jgi:hypothetical protein
VTAQITIVFLKVISSLDPKREDKEGVHRMLKFKSSKIKTSVRLS